MGRASREKRQRRAVREAVLSGAARVENAMCESCAFVDPTAQSDDPELLEKLRRCFSTGERFVCHRDFPQDASGRYRPTRDHIRAAPLCAGFAAVRREFERRRIGPREPK